LFLLFISQKKKSTGFGIYYLWNRWKIKIWDRWKSIFYCHCEAPKELWQSQFLWFWDHHVVLLSQPSSWWHSDLKRFQQSQFVIGRSIAAKQS